jgi:membrane-associated phospholipid phosphatase
MLFYHFIKNIVKVFSSKNIMWIVLAILSTWASVATGFDWFYFTELKGGTFYAIVFPAVFIGGFLPILLPLLILAIGHMRSDKRLLNTGWALGQAAILGWLISSTLKAFTGRIPPPFVLTQSTIDNSLGFNFGFMREGIFWGWPSSHTTIAFAMALTLIYLYPHHRKLRTASLAYALYIGLGISVSIHWFSEFIAGAIIGTVIGMVVGYSFYKKIHHTKK